MEKKTESFLESLFQECPTEKMDMFVRDALRQGDEDLRKLAVLDPISRIPRA